MNVITKWIKTRQVRLAEERLAQIKAMMEQTGKYHEVGKPGSLPYSMVKDIINWKSEIAALTVRVARLQEDLSTP